MFWNLPTDERGRHSRALVYCFAAFALAAFGYLYLGFDRSQTVAYAVLTFVLFTVNNHRSMFGAPVGPPSRGGPEVQS